MKKFVYSGSIKKSLLSLIKDNKRRITLVLIILCLLLFRYDFTYNLLPYKVNNSDTLWSILEKKVYHNPAITGLSLQYLQSTHPDMDFNKIMRNINGKGGYAISIFFNKITIFEPKDNKPIVELALILPPHALINHAILVISHNIIIFSIAFFLYIALKHNQFQLNKSFFKNTFYSRAFIIPIIVIFSILLMPIILYILLVILIIIFYSLSKFLM